MKHQKNWFTYNSCQHYQCQQNMKCWHFELSHQIPRDVIFNQSNVSIYRFFVDKAFCHWIIHKNYFGFVLLELLRYCLPQLLYSGIVCLFKQQMKISNERDSFKDSFIWWFSFALFLVTDHAGIMNSNSKVLSRYTLYTLCIVYDLLSWLFTWRIHFEEQAQKKCIFNISHYKLWCHKLFKSIYAPCRPSDLY